MEYSWYVDVILQLITIAGEFVADDIWFRVVQIITNNEVLQESSKDSRDIQSGMGCILAKLQDVEGKKHANCHGFMSFNILLDGFAGAQ